jgi:hypothetical protein
MTPKPYSILIAGRSKPCLLRLQHSGPTWSLNVWARTICKRCQTRKQQQKQPPLCCQLAVCEHATTLCGSAAAAASTVKQLCITRHTIAPAMHIIASAAAANAAEPNNCIRCRLTSSPSQLRHAHVIVTTGCQQCTA